MVSEIAGTVIKKHITRGEFAKQTEEVFIVADLESVWVDLDVYRKDFPRLRVGQQVHIEAGEGIDPADSTIDYISPFVAESTQTTLARAELANPTGVWKPGLFVTAEIAVESTEVPVAVAAGAIQRLGEWDVAFVRYGDVYQARPVEIGRRDGDRVEIVSGLEAGEEYVAENSFVLKADLGKSGAGHDH